MRLPQDRILHIDTEFKDGKVNIVAEWQGEIVRCKDCEYYETGTNWTACTYWSGDPYEQAATEPDDFCSYGVAKMKGGDE